MLSAATLARVGMRRVQHGVFLRTNFRRVSQQAGKDAAPEQVPVSARGPISWPTLALATVAAGGAVVYYNVAKQRKQETAGQGKVESYGQPLLGGPWSMVDGKGVPVTSGAFPGKHLLLYFGFTFCPDICPNELVKMSKVVDAMGEQEEPALHALKAALRGQARHAPPSPPPPLHRVKGLRLQDPARLCDARPLP